MMELVRAAWRRHKRDSVDEVVDLRDDADGGRSDDEYHCMTIHLNVPPVRDAAADAWEQAGSLVDYSADLEEWRADRRREDLQPGHLSAAAVQVEEIDTRE